MGNLFSSLTDHRRGKVPYWLINYLEGTRFTEEKRRIGNEFAEQRDLKPLRYLLQPRTKGFVATVGALRGNAAAVYDVTIGYIQNENGEMATSFQEMYLTSGSNRVIHVHQRRIPLSQLPEEEEELKEWIYTLYQQKDELLRGFRQNGEFEGRPMRWNRMTLGYWMWCQFIIYSSAVTAAYIMYRLYHLR